MPPARSETPPRKKRPEGPPLAVSHPALVTGTTRPARYPRTLLPEPPLAVSHVQQPPPLTLLQGATTIGPARVGDRYVPPTYHELLASENPLVGLAEHVVGPARPSSVAAQDPYGIGAWEKGAGPMPMLLGTTEEVPAGIRAYHGSPHDFERFDLSKIGTGEGAQAYGHGLYFAGAEPTADFYRTKLSPRPDVLVGGRVVPTRPPGSTGITTPVADFFARQAAHDADATVAARIASKTHQQATIGRPLPLDVVLNHIDAELEQGMYRAAEGRGNPRLYQDLRAQRLALERFREQGVGLTRPGHMYEVNLKVDPEHLLDWDKRVTEQTPYVQGAVRRAEPDLALEPWARGEELHDVLGAQGLREAGVPGLRYLDQNSRNLPDPAQLQQSIAEWRAEGARIHGTPQFDAETKARLLRDVDANIAHYTAEIERARQPTYNYTMFDDKLIDILRKYGILPPIAAAGALSRPWERPRDQVATPPPVR